MDHRVRALFHEVADLGQAEREEIYSARQIEPEVRSEVETLLHFDSSGDLALTQSISLAAAETLAQRESVEGRFCGPYRLVRLLGSGGMGAVYLAERGDGEIQQRVAVKLLRADTGRTSWQDRFLKERQFLAYLNHAAVARLLDAGRTLDGRPYLAMEYVDGVPIDVYAAKKPLREQLELFVKVCDGVAHAHSHLIVHRDLKPSNILVDASGQPKLLDFGIAKLLADETGDETQTVDRLLTPGYASPEQLRGEIPTTATDVYSLGAVLYRLVTGRSPHESETGTSQALEVLTGIREVAAPRRVNKDVPRDLDFILRKALRREPDERYASVEALANDIRALLELRPVAARSGDSWYRSRKFLRRHWLPAAASALVIASLGAGAYLANRQRVVAERRFGELRQLANRVFDLDQAIRDLPGSIQARQRLVAASLQYLQGLAADAHGDLDLTREVADGYRRVAVIQGVPTDLNLGEFAEAETNLKKADELLGTVLAARPNDRSALLDSAIAAQDLMILAQSKGRQAEAVEQARRAGRRIDRFMRRGDATQSERIAAVGFYENIALAYTNMHMYSDAIPYARRAVELARPIHSAAYRVAESLSVLARTLLYQGDLEGALAAIQEARRIAEQAVYPNETQRMFSMYGVLTRQGYILGSDDGISLGRTEDAIEPFQKAFDLIERAARRDAKDEASRSRSDAGYELGNILRWRNPRRALVVYDTVIRRLREIPHDPAARRTQAEILAGSSYALRRLHRAAEASQRVDAAVAVLRDTKDLPAKAVPLDSDAYVVLCALADDQAAHGNLSGAIRAYEQLLDEVSISRSQPLTDLRDAPHMSHLYEALAGLYRRVGDKTKAGRMESQKLALWRNWEQKLPGNAYILRQLAKIPK